MYVFFDIIKCERYQLSSGFQKVKVILNITTKRLALKNGCY